MQFKQVQEATYLTAEKAWSYRAILRYFYIQHERMREFLFSEEVYEHLKSLPGFEDYTEEQLHQDLDQLVRWNNLHTIQETGRARTIEEFKKKRFRYQCTPYTVEFERMLVEMEADGETFGGSLEKKEFERLYQTLYELEKLLKRSSLPERDECAQIWNDLFTYFRSIKKNTSDYIAHINSEEADGKDMKQMNVENECIISPVVYRESEDDPDFAYIRNYRNRLREDLAEHTLFRLELFKKNAQLVSEERKQELTLFPVQKTIMDIAIHFASYIREHIEEFQPDEFDQIRMTPVKLEQTVKQ